ncbi:DUF881 domain-containing protein [Aquibacillus koreensis]|uniref:DUF881 domain-containing protein n=1 Tax=Aquibacillus koreensis TaxID=279446 RepID=A0A9X4AJQ7_9BACI|nr:DUF881 domain-containing protein [Aquibacillus koreensis]MCT2538055.1 DUF881 domain-containing protein [Aquibacillus koreensis]MDC3420578.1 DUF881 domain-containing protein [Aquibacillus koreensis]
MRVKKKVTISIICAFVGFLVAIQFQSTKEPTERDTRDLWEIRSQLQVEQKQQQELYKKIAETVEMKEQYEAMSEQEQIEALTTSIEELEEKAGLKSRSGKGVRIRVEPIIYDMQTEQQFPELSPELLNRLVNELNNYGATDIAVGNERIINISPIRYVNGKTYVNNRAIPSLPIEIKVLANNPERLLNHLEVSQSRDEFAIEDLELKLEIDNQLDLPKFEGNINLEGIEVYELEEVGEE